MNPKGKQNLSSPKPAVRGVFELEREFPGLRGLFVVTAKGKKVLQLHVATDVVSPNLDLVEVLRSWLNAVDPPLTLVTGNPDTPARGARGTGAAVDGGSC